MLTWTECYIALSGRSRRIAKAEAIGWMWPSVTTRPLRVRLTAALTALGLGQALTTGRAARDHTAARPAQS